MRALSCEFCGRDVEQGHEVRIALEEVIVLVCSPACREAVFELTTLEDLVPTFDDRDRR